jgi:hypothetical protein
VRGSAFVLALGLLVATAATAASAEEISARAEAGLAGVARSGRWTPIVVTVENNGRPVEATVTVSLDSERVTRPLTLAAPSRKRLEFFLRAPETDRTTAQVVVTANEQVLASTRAELRVTEATAPFTICVMFNGGSPTGACTATLDAAAMPTSWRAFDAVDDVLWPDGASATTLDREQRTAWERASAVRAFNNSPAMAPQWPSLPAPTAGTGIRSRMLTAYTVVLFVLAWFLARFARRPALSYSLAAVLIVGGTGAVIADGRFGSAARIAESTIIRAGEGFDGAQVLVRAAVLFSAPQSVDVRTSLDDAFVDGGTIAGGRAFRGQRVSLEASGFIDGAPVAVHRRGATIEFHNRLSSPLTNCTVGTTSLARIDAGASTSIAENALTEDAALACEIERAQARLSLTTGTVAHEGRSVLLVQLHSGAAQ